MPDDPNNAPTELERLEARRNELLQLQEAMAAKRKAHPNDFGIRVWWGFVIVGPLVGWMRAPNICSIVMYGVVFWLAGMFFSVFAIDSAEVQSKIALFLHKLGEGHISKWLYTRALTIR